MPVNVQIWLLSPFVWMEVVEKIQRAQYASIQFSIIHFFLALFFSSTSFYSEHMNRNHFEQVHGAYYYVWRWTNFNTLSSCVFFASVVVLIFLFSFFHLMKLALELISSEDDWCLCCTSLSSLWLVPFLYENILIKCILQFALFSSSMSGFRWVYMQKRYNSISLKYWVLVVHKDFFCHFTTSYFNRTCFVLYRLNKKTIF